jgi:hypothetical protein
MSRLTLYHPRSVPAPAANRRTWPFGTRRSRWPHLINNRCKGRLGQSGEPNEKADDSKSRFGQLVLELSGEINEFGGGGARGPKSDLLRPSRLVDRVQRPCMKARARPAPDLEAYPRFLLVICRHHVLMFSFEHPNAPLLCRVRPSRSQFKCIAARDATNATATDGSSCNNNNDTSTKRRRAARSGHVRRPTSEAETVAQRQADRHSRQLLALRAGWRQRETSILWASWRPSRIGATCWCSNSLRPDS